jgi:hypothetical protein
MEPSVYGLTVIIVKIIEIVIVIVEICKHIEKELGTSARRDVCTKRMNSRARVGLHLPRNSTVLTN